MITIASGDEGDTRVAVTFVGWPVGADLAGLDPAAGPGALAAAVQDPASPVDPVEVVDALPSGDQVLVAWAPGIAGGGHGLRVARALSMRTDVAVVEVDCSPTQAEALRLATTGWPSGVPAVALRELAGYLRSAQRTVAVITSVSRLSDPAPSVVQHALSALPWTRFTVDYDFDRVQLGGQPPRRSHGLLGPVVAAASDAAATALLEPLLDWAGSPARLVSPPGGAGPAARRWAEVTVLPDAPGRLLTRWAAALVVQTCPSCERSVTGASCLFCGAAQPDVAPPPEPPPPPDADAHPTAHHTAHHTQTVDLHTLLEDAQ